VPYRIHLQKRYFPKFKSAIVITKELTLDADLEVARVLEKLILKELLVEGRVPHDREGCEENVVELVQPGVVQRLTSEGGIETVPELRQHEHYVLVEDVAHEERVASVRFSTVSEK
jgi:hypothetical protein